MIKKEEKKNPLESISVLLKSIDGRLNGIDRRFDALDKKFDALEVRVENVERSQRNMGVQLDRLEHKIDLCIEGFGALNERSTKLEDRVSVLEGRV